MIRRVSGLDAVIDQAGGEIATLPFHPRALRGAGRDMLIALAAWRSVADRLEVAPDAASDATRVRNCLPPILKTPGAISDPTRWRGNPRAMRMVTWTAVRRLVTLPAETPSLRLLCDRTAEGLLALCRVIDGMQALNSSRTARMPPGLTRLRLPDILPALINAVRAFLTIGTAALVWIGTAWPNGATFIIYATIGITLFAPQEDAGYDVAKSFAIGTALTAACAALVGFALLPQQSGFVGFCAVLGIVLIPAGCVIRAALAPILVRRTGGKLHSSARPVESRDLRSGEVL
jgi:uncharacterized membrane protein YccC